DFVHDFGAMETGQPTDEKLAEQVASIMHSPISVREDCGLLRAIAILQTNRLLDVPVVDQAGRLVGIASRVDIGAALLQGWQLV
ncbi:MAG: CBS domain-containing protein, partial [Anaerolineales bacterium]|nr:CBS domain-containing protein [Anaerolineales bacterium]